MNSFIVHAKGFVLETTAELLREHGAPVIEVPQADEVAGHLAECPSAVVVCNGIPPACRWEQRRVVLLDGVADDDVAQLVSGGAQVTRPAAGNLEALVAEVFADRSTGDASILPLRPERPLLTRRQLEVVRLIAGGLTSHEIADELGVRPKTVENYKQRLFARLGVQNQAHAVARCAHLGLIGDRPTATLAS